MIAKGEWRATARPMDERVVGFDFYALYFPSAERRDLILSMAEGAP